MAQYTSVDFKFDVPVILAYADLFQARAFQATPTSKPGDPAFQAWFLMRPDHPELEAMKAAARLAGANVWGTNVADIAWGSTITSGDAVAAAQATKETPKDKSAFNGFIILKSSTPEKNAPALAAVHAGNLVDVPMDPVQRRQFERYFYGGAEVFASVRFKATDFGGTKRVKAYLQSVTSLSRGETVPAFNAGGQKSASAIHGDAVRGHISNVVPIAAAGGANAASVM
jgi:hypothetical protein